MKITTLCLPACDVSMHNAQYNVHYGRHVPYSIKIFQNILEYEKLMKEH